TTGSAASTRTAGSHSSGETTGPSDIRTASVSTAAATCTWPRRAPAAPTSSGPCRKGDDGWTPICLDAQELRPARRLAAAFPAGLRGIERTAVDPEAREARAGGNVRGAARARGGAARRRDPKRARAGRVGSGRAQGDHRPPWRLGED